MNDLWKNLPIRFKDIFEISIQLTLKVEKNPNDMVWNSLRLIINEGLKI